MPMTTRLAQAVKEVAKSLPDALLEEAHSEAIDAKVDELGLGAQNAAPDWLYDLLSCVRDRRPTEGWINFTAASGDVMNFIEELDELLPVDFENHEKQWVLTFSQHRITATLSVESKCYRVDRISESD